MLTDTQTLLKTLSPSLCCSRVADSVQAACMADGEW